MSDSLTRSRLDSFSDGVIAVIITIMVLELKVPGVHEMSNADALRFDLRMVCIYLLSFVQIGIYWVNHHYLLDDLEHVSHGVLWSNLLFLFSLSLIPFGTEWVGVRGVHPVPVAIYVSSFFVPAIAWTVLAGAIGRRTGTRPAAGPLKQAFSAAMTLAGIGVAFLSPWAALAMVTVVAFVWVLPPRRIVEKTRTHAPARTTRHDSA